MELNVQPIIFNTSCRSSNNKELSSLFYHQYQQDYDSPFHRKLRRCLELYFQQNNDIKKSDIQGFAGHGGLSTIFDLGEKGVLKCSQENPLEFRNHNAEFDIPFTSPVVKINDFYIVQEPKAETTSVTQMDCIDVIKRMSNEGFEPSLDFDKTKTRQVGFYNGRPYLLDTRCALPKPDKFSLEIYNFCDRNRRVFYPRETDLKDFGHIVERPRANLSIKEAGKMVKKIIKDNVKLGYSPLNDGFYGLLKLIIKCIMYKRAGY